MLKEYGYFDSKAVKTPFDQGCHLRKNLGELVNQKRYYQIIGSVSYLMNNTRPDIALAIGKLSQFTHNPGEEHWHAINRLMRYLKDTMNYGLHYSGIPVVLEGYCDANWISDTNKSLATSGARAQKKLTSTNYQGVVGSLHCRQQGSNDSYQSLEQSLFQLLQGRIARIGTGLPGFSKAVETLLRFEQLLTANSSLEAQVELANKDAREAVLRRRETAAKLEEAEVEVKSLEEVAAKRGEEVEALKAQLDRAKKKAKDDLARGSSRGYYRVPHVRGIH
ncbi:uncharacterized protein LOC122668546 [Telopea speciosissima]|uniref:uncharacterized protein LOC122668546 n=1 Tax=Telopea speciosissima TaxID=54955 RepID=UPI001CC56C12|nr:uncharacterized protein LOC122668546 [Telopea speciosissima]